MLLLLDYWLLDRADIDTYRNRATRKESRDRNRSLKRWTTRVWHGTRLFYCRAFSTARFSEKREQRKEGGREKTQEKKNRKTMTKNKKRDKRGVTIVCWPLTAPVDGFYFELAYLRRRTASRRSRRACKLKPQ